MLMKLKNIFKKNKTFKKKRELLCNKEDFD